MDESVLGPVRSQATEIARGWSPPGAPPSWALTASIFSVLAEDEELLGLAAEIPAERMPALLFCAASCYLVDRHQPPGLVHYFPVAGRSQPGLDGDFAPAFRAFCLDHRAELLGLVRHRRYQMNEVARCTQVALALAVLDHRPGPEGTALIDIGAGAGLGLHPDRYGHRLSTGEWLGDRGSPLVLDCEARGPVPPGPYSLPRIGWRVGIDLDPADLARPDDRRWMLSCVPPETDSRARFDRAARIALAHPCRIVRGNAVELLPDVLEEVPDRLYPVVVDSYTAVFFSNPERAELGERLRRWAGRRDLAWISLDPLVPLGTAGRHSVQGLDVPPDLVTEYQRHGVFALLGVVSFDRGRRRGRVLAHAHPSGTSLSWL